MKPVSQLRKIQFNPYDPTWTFPWATRKYIEKLRRYFIGGGIFPAGQYFKTAKGKSTHALDRKKSLAMRKRGIIWPSVPRKFLKRALAEYEKRKYQHILETGSLTPGKDRSIRMNVCWMARYVWTGKKDGMYMVYVANKRMWLAYLAWEKSEELKRLPKTPSKLLDVA